MPPRHYSRADPLLPPSLPIIILCLLCCSSHVLRQISVVKRGWDSLYVSLVLFAVLCGILARRNDDEPTFRGGEDDNTSSYSIDSVMNDWLDDRDYSTFHCHRRQGSEIQDKPKEIPVETFVLRSSESPAPPLPPPPLPPPTPARRQKQGRANRSVGHRQKVDNSSDQCDAAGLKEIKSRPQAPPPPPASARQPKKKRANRSVRHRQKGENSSDQCDAAGLEKIKSPPQAQPPPPPPPRRPPPPPVATVKTEQKYSKKIKMAWALFDCQTKRKKEPKRKNQSDDYSDHAPEDSVYTKRSPPPTPSPSPPPSVLPNIFRKGSKSKRIHSFPEPPPPPPPPRSTPPPTRPAESSRRRLTGTTGRPPLSTRTEKFYDETAKNGGQPPLIPMPPPPPPTGSDGVKKGCPSPDVNEKAYTFIARQREGWRLEQTNSVMQNYNLAREPGPGPSMRW